MTVAIYFFNIFIIVYSLLINIDAGFFLCKNSNPGAVGVSLIRVGLFPRPES
jgi:hypothetical protein